MMTEERRDFLWIIVVSGLILLWSSIPTWVGYRAETPQLRFRGLYFDSQDYSAHIAMMEAGAQGEWAYQFRFSAEPMRSAYVRIFYIFLGHISTWLGLRNEQTFDLARLILGFVALFTLYKLVFQVFQDRFWARVAFLLAAIGSGLGWLQLVFGWTSGPITPIDFWLIDDYVFFSLSVFPHFAFVTAGMCIALSCWFSYLAYPSMKNITWIVLISTLIQFTNPIAFAPVDAAFAGAVLFDWWNTRKFNKINALGLVILAVTQLPVLIYNLLVFSHDPLWNQYTIQHQTLSPPPNYYFWGFAPFLPFATIGIISAFRDKSSRLGAFVFWTFAGFSLAYSPLHTQVRFLQNITIPLGILATQGWIKFFASHSKQRISALGRKKSWVILFVFIASLSSIQLSLGRAFYLQGHPKQFYYPKSVDAAISWLGEHAQYNDIALASETTSQVLAQKAGIRVYGGHQMETINYEVKNRNIISFFKGHFPDLATPPIKWVIYGPDEKLINPNFVAPNNLELVYETTGLKIYQVK